MSLNCDTDYGGELDSYEFRMLEEGKLPIHMTETDMDITVDAKIPSKPLSSNQTAQEIIQQAIKESANQPSINQRPTQSIK